MFSTDNYCIVISLGPKHTVYCRCLLSSIRYFGITAPIYILNDGNKHIEQLARISNVTIIDTKEINKNHDLKLTGLLNKLNLYFLPEAGYDYDYYVHFDADSFLLANFENKYTGKEFDFAVMQGGVLDFSDKENLRIFNKYAYDPNVGRTELLASQIYFSSGHFIINKKLFDKDHLRLYRKDINTDFSTDAFFKFGDQGYLNFYINELNLKGNVILLDDIGLYGKEPNMFDCNDVINKKYDTKSFIHYTGPSRHAFLFQHNYSELLKFYTKLFYKYISKKPSITRAKDAISETSIKDIYRLLRYHLFK